jgi:hypothetical protein
LWRETSFAFHLIKQAVNPVLSLEDCLKNWREIAGDFAENPRIRERQNYKMYTESCQEYESTLKLALMGTTPPFDGCLNPYLHPEHPL